MRSTIIATAALLASKVRADSQPRCAQLSDQYPDHTATEDGSAYDAERKYWSVQQASVRPACFISPDSPEMVADIVKTLSSQNAVFTVKGGGHAAFAGASTLADGVVIDMQNLNALDVSDDRKTVSVGPGNRWIDVANHLDPMGLAVVGGRAGDVGVAGLTLGGGISYFSDQYGWACDNVNKYQVVLGSGEIVDATPSENSDLYFALRGGGGSNFGIVTRFDFMAFEQGHLWKRSLVYPGAMNHTVIQNYTQSVISDFTADTQTHSYLVLSYAKAAGGYIVLTALHHATPPPKGTTPPAFAGWDRIPGAVSDNVTVASLSEQMASIDEPYGYRHNFEDITVKLIPGDFFQTIIDHWKPMVDRLLAAAADEADDAFVPYLAMQPITINAMRQMQKNGGNTFPLQPDTKFANPKMNVQVQNVWSAPSLDAVIEQETSAFMDKVNSMALADNYHEDYIYMNYAAENQKVLQFYGYNTWTRLKDIAAKYDPDGVFKRLWKGYFKLE